MSYSLLHYYASDRDAATAIATTARLPAAMRGAAPPLPLHASLSLVMAEVSNVFPDEFALQVAQSSTDFKLSGWSQYFIEHLLPCRHPGTGTLTSGT